MDGFKDAYHFVKRHLRFAVDLIVIFGVGFGIYTKINADVHKLLSERFDWYDDYLKGVIASTDGRYDDAISEFDFVFPSFMKSIEFARNRPPAAALCSNYLVALANCRQPDKYSAQFTRVSKVFDATLSPETRDLISIGWYKLRTGSAEAADKAFRRGLQMVSGYENQSDIAQAYRGLMLVSLANDDVPRALANFREANQRDTSVCNTCYLDETSAVIKELTLLYPRFASARQKLEHQLPVDTSAYDAYYSSVEASPSPNVPVKKHQPVHPRSP
jgi:tetratricopeptide (TPR) repeat protein